MGRVFRKMQDRRGSQSRGVGVHTMVSCVVSYLGELHTFATVMAGTPDENARREAWAVLDAEYRNFEQAAVNYLKGGN